MNKKEAVRQNTFEMIEVMLAYLKGEKVESRAIESFEWRPVTFPIWDWKNKRYRIVESEEWFNTDIHEWEEE